MEKVKLHKLTENLIGQIFGKLTVIKFAGYKIQKAQWLCKCECGNIKPIYAQCLKKGKTISCNNCNPINIGDRFGKLTIIEFDGYKIRDDGRNRAYWKCLCECGNISSKRANGLKNGNINFCGCSYHRKGTEHPSYKTNISDKERIIHRNTPQYPIWREAVYERNNFSCQCCGKRGGNLEAHHLENWADNPELRYDIDNGVTLCKECHRTGPNAFHKKYGKRNTTTIQTQQFINNHK